MADFWIPPFLISPTPYMCWPLVLHMNLSPPVLFTKSFYKVQQGLLQATTLYLLDLPILSFCVREKEGICVQGPGSPVGTFLCTCYIFIEEIRPYHPRMGTLPPCSGCSWAFHMQIKKVNLRSPTTIFFFHHLSYLLRYKGLQELTTPLLSSLSSGSLGRGCHT